MQVLQLSQVPDNFCMVFIHTTHNTLAIPISEKGIIAETANLNISNQQHIMWLIYSNVYFCYLRLKAMTIPVMFRVTGC